MRTLLLASALLVSSVSASPALAYEGEEFPEQEMYQSETYQEQPVEEAMPQDGMPQESYGDPMPSDQPPADDGSNYTEPQEYQPEQSPEYQQHLMETRRMCEEAATNEEILVEEREQYLLDCMQGQGY